MSMFARLIVSPVMVAAALPGEQVPYYTFLILLFISSLRIFSATIGEGCRVACAAYSSRAS